jgi:hypothetical protein
MMTQSVSSAVSAKWLALFSGMLCLSVATSAPAAETARPCRDDAARLCQGVQPGEGRVARCLKQHSNELSPACKNNIAKMKEEIKKAREACKDDAKKLCGGIKPGGGKIAQCLKQHESELSPACKAQMEKPRGKK